MLKVPEKEQSGTKQEIPPPCYRCLFDTFLAQGCDPTTCQMLDAWLADDSFSWDKYELKWLLGLERENVKKNHPPKEE